MTGFGVGESDLERNAVSVEIRSLNHRFLDVRVRMPPELSEHLFFMEQACRERLSRGRYDVSVRLRGTADGGPARLDTRRAKAVFAALCELRDELAPGQDVPVAALASVTDLLTPAQPENPEPVRSALLQALSRGLDALDEMRQREGDALALELRERVGECQSRRNTIEELSGDSVALYRRRLQERLNVLLGDSAIAVEAGRLEAEIALLAERTDITEELARLDSHFAQFESLMTESGPSGRRLDFLLQEISRETNTIGAKSQSAELAAQVVHLKSEIERLREQVQNVE